MSIKKKTTAFHHTYKPLESVRLRTLILPSSLAQKPWFMQGNAFPPHEKQRCYLVWKLHCSCECVPAVVIYFVCLTMPCIIACFLCLVHLKKNKTYVFWGNRVCLFDPHQNSIAHSHLHKQTALSMEVDQVSFNADQTAPLRMHRNVNMLYWDLARARGMVNRLWFTGWTWPTTACPPMIPSGREINLQTFTIMLLNYLTFFLHVIYCSLLSGQTALYNFVFLSTKNI